MDAESKKAFLQLRRLVRGLGALVLVLGLTIVGQQVHFNSCLGNNFHRLSDTLAARADLAGRDPEATQRFILVAVESKTTSDFTRALAAYKKDLKATEDLRAANPIPPFPKGKCGVL